MLHEDGIVEVTTKDNGKTVHVNLNYQQDKCWQHINQVMYVDVIAVIEYGS